MKLASSATSSGGRWFVGSFEQTLPPIVPRFRTCTSAIIAATSPRIDRAPAASSPISCAYVVIAPISTEPLPRSRTPRSSSRSWRSTRTSGEAARAFITLTSVCPPASARAPSSAASNATASSTVFGRAYCTSRRSIGAFSNTGHRLRRERRPSAQRRPVDSRKRFGVAPDESTRRQCQRRCIANRRAGCGRCGRHGAPKEATP